MINTGARASGPVPVGGGPGGRRELCPELSSSSAWRAAGRFLLGPELSSEYSIRRPGSRCSVEREKQTCPYDSATNVGGHMYRAESSNPAARKR